MKRIALLFLAVCLTSFMCAEISIAQTAEDSCTRENLNKITDMYFKSIQKPNTSDLPLASTVKFTDNGVEKEVGKGFWETTGKSLLRRTLIDTKKCTTATISVIEEPFSSKTVGSCMMGGGPKPKAGAPAEAGSA